MLSGTLQTTPTLPDMPELTIGRMAQLYGLHRSSLYEAVGKGRVTAGFNSKEQRVIDLSEMIRVYGEPPSKPSKPSKPDIPDTSKNQPEIARPTRDPYSELSDELRLLRQEVRELREAMRTLPAPGQLAIHPDHRLEERPSAPPSNAVPAKEDAPRDRPPPAQSFGDLLERLKNRTT